MEDYYLTPMEAVFLVVAILVTIPILIFLKFILRELKKEPRA